jgi:hemerythrin superfamily protein
MAAADAVSMIEQDHRALETLFGKVRSGDGDRTALLEQITVQLTAHARAEEQEVYPAIKQADPAEDVEVEHAHDEHHEAEHLLRSARNLTASPHFEEAFDAFVTAVGHHVEEEEREILPALRAAVDTATLRKLGAAFEQTRTGLVAELNNAVGNKRQALGGTSTRQSAGKRQTSRKRQPAADATRDELYELAKQADIPGRSSMTKQELADALHKA